MPKVVYYRTYSRDIDSLGHFSIENFGSEEQARQRALNDQMSDTYSLSEITITVENGIYTETEKDLGRIPCYWDKRNEIDLKKKYN